MGEKKILVGTRSGDIWEIDQTTRKKQLEYEEETYMKRRMFCCDNEIPLVVGFSKDKDRIFYFSDKGYFCVWNMRTLSYAYDNPFNRTALNMHVCQRSNDIILVFEDYISILDANDRQNYMEKYSK